MMMIVVQLIAVLLTRMLPAWVTVYFYRTVLSNLTLAS